jgi:hypothetical protein
MNSKQTLFIPEYITIELRNKNEEPLHQANILLGIMTHASFRNDIDIYPLISDKKGIISLKKDQIIKMANEFISYGIMDYSSLESAKPDIELYFWGKRNINIYLGYEVDPQLERALRISIPNFDVEHYKKQRIEQMKEEKNYLAFKNSFNRLSDVENDLTLVQDLWDKPRKEVHYKITLPF